MDTSSAEAQQKQLDRAKAYLAEVAEVGKKHGLDLQPVLMFTKAGVTPSFDVIESTKPEAE